MTAVKINRVLFCLLAFVLPVYHKIVPPVLILLLLSSVWVYFTGEKSRVNFNLTSLWLMCGLFVVYLLGLLYTENISNGWKIIESKLSLIVFPLIFFFGGGSVRPWAKKVLYFFILGVLVSFFVCLGWALYQYLHEFELVKSGELHDRYTNINYFFASLFSPFFHPSYLSLYANLALLIVLQQLYTRQWSEKLPRWAAVPAIVVLLVFIFLLASKAGLILAVVTLLGYVLVMLLRSRFRKLSAVVLLVITALLVFLGSRSSIVASRFTYMFDSMFTMKVDPHSSEGNNIRKIAYLAAWHQYKASPLLGYGTGDVQDQLDNYYKTNGFGLSAEQHFNCHNQFLQTGMGLGIPGILLLTLLFVYPFFLYWRKIPLLLAGFLVMILINILFESMFETQAGIVFFGFFYCFFITAYPKPE
jgi:O-antigen ligase